MSPVTAFSSDYVQARERFRQAAGAAGATLQVHAMPAQRAPGGEPLSMDVARIGAPGAGRVLIVSSGTHGVEGFCGSGVQVALLRDAPLLADLAAHGVALVLVHAVNPYGFAHLHRTNEDNIDLNRNAVDFGRARPPSADYAELHPDLVPPVWPSPDADQRIADFVQRRGMDAFRVAVTTGQYTHPDGLFYGGAATSWSVQRLCEVLDTHASQAAQVGWIDVHTGLGPCGHGEKIHAISGDASGLQRARRWWGADVTDTGEGSSTSVDVSGPCTTLAPPRCRGAVTAIALEVGTQPMESVLLALRADAWRRAHPDAPAATRESIARQLRDAFFVDRDDWKAMVLGQSRVAVLQALRGLCTEPGRPA
ncbi:MAG: M14 family metallopeptidase [Rubrivivax sp.]